MDETYILYDNDEFNEKIHILLNDGSFEKRIDTTDSTSDEELHDFVVNNIFKRHTDIEKLIIPLKIGDYDYLGLKMALHIRLNSEIGDKNLIPIILYSDNIINSIYYDNQDNSSHPAYILNRKGIALVDNLSDLSAEVNAIEPLTSLEYLHFLSSLKIEGIEGKHSLANFWGAYRLDQIVSGGKILAERPDLIDKQKTLHFKYLKAFHSSVQSNNESNNSFDIIESSNKKILLIDDEHDKGWTEVLSVIFKDARFEFINRTSKTYEEFEIKIKQQITEDWDLILLDLRLNPSVEDTQDDYIDNPIDFSGTKILEEIKEQNIGTQVIIFTASNKAWNMRKLMTLSADGYYIKETPEFNFSNEVTKQHYQNFKEDVTICYKKDFLRKHFEIQQEINEYLTNETLSATGRYKSFLLNINSQFKLAFDSSLAINFDKESTIDIAFIMYFQCFEIFKDYYYNRSTTRKYSVIGSKRNYTVNNIIEGGNSDLFSTVVDSARNYFSINIDEYLKKLQIFIWKRNDYIHKNKLGANFKKEHFSIDELKEIVDIIYKLVSENLKA